MKKSLLICLLLFIQVYANQVFFELNEKTKSIVHNNLKFFIKDNHLYCENLKNKNLNLLLDNIESKIEIINSNNLYAIEIARGQVNTSYSLYRLDINKFNDLNIDIVNPIFQKNKIFSYERSGPQWYLDIYCITPTSITQCGKGKLSQINNTDMFETEIYNKTIYYTFNAKMIDNIFTIESQKQRLYSKPNVKTKMYLIKGDKVEILEKKDDWYYILYHGKKDIKAWIPKSAVE
ncbi:SH3 domain-containing protein [Halarcobacter anaerophilus]|uniref:SH3b domain-containing protein n=1 Tax=Halarcobacter anaerophilus TaxID=877500 RepID=A0A4Q0XVB9_9BACT|nr:SH3 domain-containing protein [Halarcobacter anaerophilus]QDF28503.1 hypothetical protein AANAER_1016 [Halarcobacter anaerophilus]RXJ61093.1 hypothetical protein CRV06_14735 [Halarcobacter anaerophilus]